MLVTNIRLVQIFPPINLPCQPPFQPHGPSGEKTSAYAVQHCPGPSGEETSPDAVHHWLVVVPEVVFHHIWQSIVVNYCCVIEDIHEKIT